jgi:hypothetical protein
VYGVKLAATYGGTKIVRPLESVVAEALSAASRSALNASASLTSVAARAGSEMAAVSVRKR